MTTFVFVGLFVIIVVSAANAMRIRARDSRATIHAKAVKSRASQERR